MPDHDITLPDVEAAVQWQKPGTSPQSDEKMLKPLTTGNEISIHVKTEDPHPMPARFSRVHLEPVPADNPTVNRKPGFSAISDLDGTVHFEHVPQGEYLMFAELEGFISPFNEVLIEPNGIFGSLQRDELLHSLRRVRIEETTAQAETIEITLSLKRGSVITGQFAFDDGAPAVGIRLDVFASSESQVAERRLIALDGGRYGLEALHASTTDENGAYRIAGIPAGNYFVRGIVPVAGSNGNDNLDGNDPSDGQVIGEDTAEAFTTSSGKVILNHTIPLKQWKTLKGRISIQEGPALIHAEVELKSTKCCNGVSRRLVFKGNGSFVIKYLPPGTYNLDARGWQPISNAANDAWNTKTLEFRQTLAILPQSEPAAVQAPLNFPAVAEPAVLQR